MKKNAERKRESLTKKMKKRLKNHSSHFFLPSSYLVFERKKILFKRKSLIA
jgi:hypothetical protein